MISSVSDVGAGMVADNAGGLLNTPQPIDSDRQSFDPSRTGVVLGISEAATRYAQFQGGGDVRLDAAQRLRQADQALLSLDATLGKMQHRFEGIVKLYPPYPMDNPERIELINQINGLSKQINGQSKRIEALIDPSFAGDVEPRWDVVFPSGDVPTALNGRDAMGVKNILGFGELDPVTTTDETLRGLLGKVETAHNEVASMREGMWVDVVRLVGTTDEQSVETAARDGRSYLAAASGQSIGGGWDAASALL